MFAAIAVAFVFPVGLEPVIDTALLQAHKAERAAAPACIQALRTGPVGGEACEAYKQTVIALRKSGGKAALKDSSWELISTMWRQRSYNQHIRDYSVARPVFQRQSGY